MNPPQPLVSILVGVAILLAVSALALATDLHRPVAWPLGLAAASVATQFLAYRLWVPARASRPASASSREESSR